MTPIYMNNMQLLTTIHWSYHPGTFFWGTISNLTPTNQVGRLRFGFECGQLFFGLKLFLKHLENQGIMKQDTKQPKQCMKL